MPATDLKNSQSTLSEIRFAVEALEEKKAEDIRILDVGKASSITNFLVWPREHPIRT